MTPVTIFRTFSSAEAQVIRSRLEATGFHPSVVHELASMNMEGYSVATGGILVQVPNDEAEEARSLIESENATEE